MIKHGSVCIPGKDLFVPENPVHQQSCQGQQAPQKKQNMWMVKLHIYILVKALR
jgi:hypothetical protein